MIGQLDSFDGGLNLTGDPRNRRAFALNQAAGMDSCDPSRGPLRPLPPLGEAVSQGVVQSIHFTGNSWVHASTARSYAQQGDLTAWSLDSAEGGFGEPPVPSVFETLNGANFANSEVLGVVPPTKAQISAIETTIDLNYTAKVTGVGATLPAIDAPLAVFRQVLTLTSPNPITDISAGAHIETGAVPPKTLGNVVEVSRPDGSTGYEYDHDLSLYRVFCTVSLSVPGAATPPQLFVTGDVARYTALAGTGTSLVTVEAAQVAMTSIPLTFRSYDREEESLDVYNSNRMPLLPYDILLVQANNGPAYYDPFGTVQANQAALNLGLGRGKYTYLFTYVDYMGRESAPQLPDKDPERIEYDNSFDVASMPVEVAHKYQMLEFAQYKMVSRAYRGANSYRNEEEKKQRPQVTIESPGVNWARDERLAPATVQMTGFPELPESGAYKALRVYRTLVGGGDFFFLKEIPARELQPGHAYILYDSVSDWVLAGNPMMDCSQNYPPIWRANSLEVWSQRSGKYLTEHRGRFLLAQEDRVYFSRAGMGFAWPVSSWFQVDGAITGMASVHGELLIFTQQTTWKLSGYDERTFTLIQVPTEQGCLKAKTIARVGSTLMWVSADGPVYYDGSSVQAPLHQMIGKQLRWHSVTCAAAAGGIYWIFGTDFWLGVDVRREARVLYYVDVREGTPGFSYVATAAVAAANVFTGDDQIYVGVWFLNGGICNAVRRLFSSVEGESRSMTYLSGEDEGQYPGVLKHFTKIHVVHTGDLTIRTRIDGTEVASYSFLGGTGKHVSRYLPASQNLRGYSIQFQIEGTGTLHLVRWEAQEQTVE